MKQVFKLFPLLVVLSVVAFTAGTLCASELDAFKGEKGGAAHCRGHGPHSCFERGGKSGLCRPTVISRSPLPAADQVPGSNRWEKAWWILATPGRRPTDDEGVKV